MLEYITLQSFESQHVGSLNSCNHIKPDSVGEVPIWNYVVITRALIVGHRSQVVGVDKVCGPWLQLPCLPHFELVTRPSCSCDCAYCRDASLESSKSLSSNQKEYRKRRRNSALRGYLQDHTPNRCQDKHALWYAKSWPPWRTCQSRTLAQQISNLCSDLLTLKISQDVQTFDLRQM